MGKMIVIARQSNLQKINDYISSQIPFNYNNQPTADLHVHIMGQTAFTVHMIKQISEIYLLTSYKAAYLPTCLLTPMQIYELARFV